MASVAAQPRLAPARNSGPCAGEAACCSSDTASPTSCNTMRQQEVPRSQSTLCSTLERLTLECSEEPPGTPRPCSALLRVARGWAGGLGAHWGLQKLRIRKGAGGLQSQACWGSIRVSSKDSGVMCTEDQILPLTSRVTLKWIKKPKEGRFWLPDSQTQEHSLPHLESDHTGGFRHPGCMGAPLAGC